MKATTCARARSRLYAFYDRELAVGDQIAIAAHLKECSACARTVTDMELVGSALRAAANLPVLTADESVSFHAGVVSRVKAERDLSWPARLRGLFDDMHFVYAGFGAAAAAVVCVIIMLGMMRFATSERPDSLAAMVAFLATPGSNANMIAVDPEAQARWTARFQAATESAEQEAVFTLADVVNRDRSVAGIARLRARGARLTPEQAKVIACIDVVSRARFESGPSDGAAAAANMVGLIAHTTVRATDANARTIDAVPPAKKRAAAFPPVLSSPARTTLA
jgi:hypothetical protein